MKKKYNTKLEAVLVIAVAVVLILPSAIAVTNNDYSTTKNSSIFLNKKLSSYINPIGTNVRISVDNDEDDVHPKITRDGDGKILVTYEKESGDMQSIPIVFSEDSGFTWLVAYDINSDGFDPPGSGIVQRPDIKYCSETDEFFWTSVDEQAETPFHLMTRIASDFPSQISISGTTGTDAGAYYESAVGMVGPWFLACSIFDHTGLSLDRIPSISYNDAEWAQPPTLPQDSFYLDGQSVLQTKNSYNYEIATGAARIYIVMDHLNDTSSERDIVYKATYADLDPSSPTYLFQAGGGPGGMDKYADIEAWPFQKYLDYNAIDPDISASGSTVIVVYQKEENVVCSFSTDNGTSFSSSVVATSAGFPNVFIGADAVYCSYIKENNLFLVNSTNNGQTWGTAVQINDAVDSVVEEAGTADIGAAGIVWTDNRDGTKDIYFNSLEINAPSEPKLEIGDITGGLGVTAVLKNTGDAPATNVKWTITVKGGILGLIDKTFNDTIVSINAGNESEVTTGIVAYLRFGSVEVSVSATCNEGKTATKKVDGTQIFFITKI